MERTLAQKTLTAIQIVIACIIFLAPILWMIMASLKPSNDIARYPPTLLFTPTLANFEGLFASTPFFQYLTNSIIVAGGSTLLGLLLALPATYAISWHRVTWPSTLVLLTRIVPATLFVLPWFIIFTQLALIGGYWVLILTHTVITLPLILWVMMPYFDALPRSLFEAAFIDGASSFQGLTKIALPLVRPGIAVASILAFVSSWNFFLFALVLGSIDTKTLIVLSFNFVGEGTTDWGRLMAAAFLIAAPPIFLVFLVQRELIAGLTGGAIKE